MVLQIREREREIECKGCIYCLLFMFIIYCLFVLFFILENCYYYFGVNSIDHFYSLIVFHVQMD
ncbi:hypothetical protein BJ944DRAFT_269322 [Cunninghamella echinulata]|nr:hypothetical protein BJ944DRAFT_269322 [Cunninghamella echinulata]